MNPLRRLIALFTSDGDRPTRLPSPDELTLLTRPNGEPEAGMYREMLAGQDIPAMVKNRDPVSAQAGGMGPAWAYELWVRRKDLRRAREALGIGDETDDDA